MRLLSRVAYAGMFGSLALGCGGEPSGPKEPPIASVCITGNPANLQLGSSVTVNAQAKDAAGGILTGKVFAWSTNASSVVTVGQDGIITAVGIGQAMITASTGGKSASVAIEVIPIPVANVMVTLSAPQVAVGQTAQATAVATDALGRTLQRSVSWTSSHPTLALVDGAGVVTGLAAGGPVSIIATVEGVTGAAAIFVVGIVNCGSGALQLGVGESRLLAGAERASFCVGAGVSSQYLLIPFNASTIASSNANLQLAATNTMTPIGASISANTTGQRKTGLDPVDDRSAELAFRIRERENLRGPLRRLREEKPTSSYFKPSLITGVPATPVTGALHPVNVNVSGNTCSGAKVLRDARVAAVTPQVVVLVDTQSPAGGYTDEELTGFAQTFEATGYAVTSLNFGTPTDIDSNGRVVILFTPSVNALSGSSGGIVGGLQAARDLFPVTSCVGSNEGEMFYMPVPDPASTINGAYTNKTELARRVQGTLAHELQHLINAGRRIYVNDAFDFEEVWLNEGLSHIAEELVYYQVSGNPPRSNVDLPKAQSSQAQLDAVNIYMVQNLGRLITYLRATESNSPYAQDDKLETRGATWQLLRFAADRQGGDERAIWFSMANARTSGQENFNAALGNITATARHWVIAQYVDDTSIPTPVLVSFPSWNFRSLLPALNQGVYPLTFRSLVTNQLDITLGGGGAAYVRFGVGAGVTASVTASSSGQPLHASVDLILLRTQ